jgi:hypothetical protein
MLAHRFPPSGGAGVQRNLQLARHLPEVGVRPIVITGPGTVDYHWMPADRALSDQRLQAEIHRLRDDEPPQGQRWEARFERWLRTRSRWERWWNREAPALAAKVGPGTDLVHASIAPYFTAGAAIRIARQLRLPLVMDFEDPWALDDMLVYPTRWHRAIERREMGRMLGRAEAIVMNAPEARNRVLEAFPALDADRVVAIPNAFDPADFEAPVADRDDGRFRILHAGSLHTAFGLEQRSASRARRVLGGAAPGVDFLTRSHVYLLEALGNLLDRRPELSSSVEVVLAGVFTPADREVAARYEFVTLHDFVPHAGTLELMRTADLLFLPLYDLPPGRRAGLIPHKTYEYLAAGRPILAAVPDGDARDLLEASGVARLARPADTSAIESHLEVEIDRWRAGVAPPAPDPAVVQRASSARLMRDLAALYDAVVRR